MRSGWALVLVLGILIGSARAAPVGPQIDRVMAPWRKPTTPGCAVAVVQRGKLVHAKGYGMADLERAVPITPDTRFDIGSTSKQFTAAVILLLAADGKLALDDDIRRYLPELPAHGGRPVTIRHLLHHTGGLRDYVTLLRLGGQHVEDVATVRETLAMLARQRGVDFAPGTKYAYSNTGYFLLAQIAERASKQPMATLVRERIFTPLGMTQSIVLDDHARLVPGRALAYRPRDGGWRLDMSQWEQTGDGAILTTVRDLAKWDANFYAPKVGGQALVDALVKPGTLADGTVLDYAAGLMLASYRGQPTVHHGGGWGGYRSQLLRFPELRTSVIALCNAATSTPGIDVQRIADVVLGRALAPAAKPTAAPPRAKSAAPSVQLAPAALDAWVGRYRDAASGREATLTRVGPKLVLGSRGYSFELTPLTPTTFRLEGTPAGDVTLELGATAPARTFTVHAETAEKFVALPRYVPTARERAGLAGRFYSREIEAVWTVEVRDSGVVVRARALDDALLLPTGKDAYEPADGGFAITFVRGPRGDVTGLRILVDGMTLPFERLR